VRLRTLRTRAADGQGRAPLPVRRSLFRPSHHREAAIRFPVAVILLLVALVAVCTLAVAVGSVPLSVGDVWRATFDPDADPSTRVIVLQLRLPRVLLAVALGGGLGTAGAAYQAVFRNPLADPFVIGSASGGSVGAVVVLASGWAGVGGAIGATATGAFAGSVLAVLLVYLIAGGGRGPAESLLLAGATVSSLCAAVVWLLSTFFHDNLPRLMGWVTGGLNLNPDHWQSLTVAGPLILISGGVLSLLGRPLDALRAGDDTARALGLPVSVVLPVVLAAASVAVAAAVAVGGVIGFIGLVAPHLARPLAGASHARLVPVSALVGAVLLVPADLLARSAAPPHELPLGAITALAGGPVFLVVLRAGWRRRVSA
jgi:iron complex transport system permease protein